MQKSLNIVFILLLAIAAVNVTPVFARAPRVVDDSNVISLPGNVHHLARPEFDRGASDPSLPMERMILSLRRSSDKQAALEKLASEQQEQGSANYHRWLSPEEFGAQFGATPEEVEPITDWLSSHGFAVDEVSTGRSSITFSGSAQQVEHAFHTPIHNYSVEGHTYHANSRDPSIPVGLADLVAGVVSLHSFPRKAMNSGLLPLVLGDVQPNYTTGSSHYISPGDFATIYNLNPLYAGGVDGSGQSIAIVGRTNPSRTDWTTFRSLMNLPAKSVQVIVNGVDPGDRGSSEDTEADLDVEWSGAVAKNADIIFVISKSTSSTDGIDLSAQYVVNNNLAPVMSSSFGSCESQMGSAEISFYNGLWQQAAVQGITVFVATGDSGAAGCNSGSDSSGSGAAINGIASTPYNVAVGGTEFVDGAGGYWNAANGAGDVSVISYIQVVSGM